MKKIFKKVIVAILIFEAKMMLKTRKPKIIAVVGSVGKTSTKDAIYSALKDSVHIRKNKKSMNSEFGVPLTILHLQTGWNNPLVWLYNIVIGFLKIFLPIKYPDYLVLEVGTDMPGDMKQTASWLNPDIVVITSLPEIPVHVEHFDSADALREEDASIISYMKKDGYLILNNDDTYVAALKETSKKKTVTFALGEHGDVQAEHYSVTYSEVKPGVQIPTGISCKFSYQDKSFPVSIQGVLGIQHLYALSAAFAVAVVLGVSEVKALEGLTRHTTPKGRMKMLLGKNDSIIVDDSYNASPIAVQKAIEMVDELQTEGKKIAVIGDMRELGTHSFKEHSAIAEQLCRTGFGNVYTYGDEAEVISKAICKNETNTIAHHAKTHREIIDHIKTDVSPGDVILVKGSQGVRMENVIKSLLDNEEQASELLVRQEDVWKNI